MGLDIYLNHYTNYSKSKELEETYDTYQTEMWKKLEELDADPSEKAKDHVRQQCKDKAAELGLDEWGSDRTHKTRIEIDSKKYPDHYFKIGYFRSSYNGGGINNVLRDLGIPDLYDIFEPNEQYEFSPDWNYALTIVKQSIKLLKKDKGYRTEAIAANLFDPDNVPKNNQEAMKIFLEDELTKHTSKSFECYSNRNGHFYLNKEGLQVHGLIPGKDFMGRPCTYIIYKNEEGKKDYLQSLEIVQETIEYVLAQKDPQAYYLSWSG